MSLVVTRQATMVELKSSLPEPKLMSVIPSKFAKLEATDGWSDEETTEDIEKQKSIAELQKKVLAILHRPSKIDAEEFAIRVTQGSMDFLDAFDPEEFKKRFK